MQNMRVKSNRKLSIKVHHFRPLEDFLACQPFFLYENEIRKRKVEKLIPRCEMDCIFEGYKRAINKIWGSKAKKYPFPK